MSKDNKNNKFDKPALSVEEQIYLLQSRGLKIHNDELAFNNLKFIGYYHFSIYALPFQKGDKSSNHHDFIENISFEDILDVYEFDRKLRLLVIDALERIEVGIKSIIINEMSTHYGPFWYEDRELFVTKFNHKKLISDIQDSIGYGRNTERMRDICIRHYYETYSSPSMPPVWMVFECVSFGFVSKLYSNLNHAEQKRIANVLGIPVPALKSWLHSLNYVRNLCAHHSRLWNRTFTIKPAQLRELHPEEFKINSKFYAQASAIWILLQIVEDKTSWSKKLLDLLNDHPNINKFWMGFTDQWEKKDFWKLEDK